mmetsp:Transcript_38518/g.60705  ORF Transcript_38518/g.60705 Transcript_38518/m.60705 type:complete len:183 (+) Transcript_38518:51-599(+)
MIYAIVISALLSSTAAIELSEKNWDAETAGKSVFVKFYAPWCGHCKKLKPDWDKLMDEINGGPGSLVADVDCTGEGQSLCQKYGVGGYPTLKYGDPGDLQDYQGGRDFNSLKKFAEENLGPTCGPANLDLCSDEVKKKIEGYMAMSPDRLEGKIRNAIRIVEEEVPFMKKVSAHMKKAKSEL